MTEITRGDWIRVRDVQGRELERRALAGIVDGRDLPVVWACRPEEWDDAQRENREPEGVPWPARDVIAVGSHARV